MFLMQKMNQLLLNQEIYFNDIYQ